jgi:ADP-glucose pyrophosphorylase
MTLSLHVRKSQLPELDQLADAERTSRAAAVLASMEIYLFRFAVLREVLGEDAQRPSTHDLGREILPRMLGRYRVEAFPFIAGIGKTPAD